MATNTDLHFQDRFKTLQDFTVASKIVGKYYSLPALAANGFPNISRLPVCIRTVLEAVLRHCDGKRVREEDVKQLANWQPHAQRTTEIPFVVARILLQDFTGVPLLVDLAAMRSALARMGKDPALIEPLVPTELVIDHSVQVDHYASSDALRLNMEMEFKRNHARYQFLKWGTQAFSSFSVIPSGVGIVHQVNLEYLTRGVFVQDGLCYPDTLVGTDSHTTMVNGLGVVGWGVGGIEAEAGMLGQPVYFLTPDVVGFHLAGKLRAGVTATDLVLHITEILRTAKVVNKFVEFFGEGAASLAATDRTTIANMAPEYGATIGFFPIDEECARYLTQTGRTEQQVEAFRAYYKAQGLWGIPKFGEVEYSQTIELDLSDVAACVAGPKRPQDRIPLSHLNEHFSALLGKPRTEGGYGVDKHHVRVSVRAQDPAAVLAGGGKQAGGSEPMRESRMVTTKNTNPATEVEMMNNRPTPDRVEDGEPDKYGNCDTSLGHGDVVIAAITSCTNTSNPSVMLAAGLLAKKAVEKGLRVPPTVKTSLAPGSRAVTKYLEKTGLQSYLDMLGFQTVGYGCTTCIGNSGPLPSNIEQAVVDNNLVVAAVLSGNRNFEARIHQNVKANFLMSPPLVVAFALAGRIGIDFESEPIGSDHGGQPVYLVDLWPPESELSRLIGSALDPDMYRNIYKDITAHTPMWAQVSSPAGTVYEWDNQSTYIREPPYFDQFPTTPRPLQGIHQARALAIFGDSITTDHISPAGTIKSSSPAGLHLKEHHVAAQDFNSYGSRRGNHEVMVRSTFANVRIQNLMVPGSEGGVTFHHPSGEKLAIFDAAMRYCAEKVPLVVIAGFEYGTGSSRDWAAKGTMLLGVRVVIAKSFERIHRSNLVGMGVLPCQWPEGVDAKSLGLDGSELFSLDLPESLQPASQLMLKIDTAGRGQLAVPLLLRIDTPIETDYYRHGGILPYMLRQLVAGK